MSDALHNPHGTAFGLMDEVYGPGTAQALRDSGGPWEWYLRGAWEDSPGTWGLDIAYRLKPQPPKPRMGVVYEYADGTISFKPLSDRGAARLTKWREVIE